MIVLQVAAPIFLTILAGYLGRRFGLINDNHNRWLNRFVYFVSLPALITSCFWVIRWTEEGLGTAVFYNLLLMLLWAALTAGVLLYLKLSREVKAVSFMAVLVGNSVYMGFPLVMHAAPESAKSIIVVVATTQLVFSLLLSLFAIEYFVVHCQKAGKYLRDMVQNPLTISLAAGVLLSMTVSPTGILGPVKTSLEMLGATASPLALIGLGAFLPGRFLREHLRAALTVSLFRLAILPLATLGLLTFAKLPYSLVYVSTLLAGMPIAVTTFVFSERYDLQKHFSANTIIISTILSVLTLPIWLVLLP